jgi:hypothetical protein
MASPTREEFLNYVHTPLANPQGDPPTGSPTKSTMRYRWRELRDWDIEADAIAYWDGLPDHDKHARLVAAGYWEVVRMQLDGFDQPFSSESNLRDPFGNAFRAPHNLAVQRSSDVHAKMWSEASVLDESPIGNADFLFVYDNKLTGIIELKTWWKVNQTQFEEVKAGMYTYKVYNANR